MLIEQVDCLDLEPLERTFDGLLDLLGSARRQCITNLRDCLRYVFVNTARVDNAVPGGENYCKVLLHFGGRMRVGPGIGETIMTGTWTRREM